MKTGSLGTPSTPKVNAAGLDKRSTLPSSLPSSQPPSETAQPDMGASGWYTSAATMGRRFASNLYALLPQGAAVSEAVQKNPNAGLAKELASAEAMEAFLAVNPVGKIKTSFEGKEKNLVHIAAHYGSPESLKVVLKHVANMSKSERDSVLNAKSTDAAYAMTPLNLAAFVHGRTEAVEILANTPGVKLNEKNAYGLTPLMSAEQASNTGALEALLHVDGVDVNAKDKDNAGVLARAAYAGRSENVEIFLKHDERRRDLLINAQEDGGKTAAHWALGRGNSEVAALLLERKDLDLTLKTDTGATAFAFFAASEMPDPKVLDSLLERENVRSFINEPWKDLTPLMHAEKHFPSELFSKLLKAPYLEVNAQDPDGRAVLGRVAADGNVEKMKMILAHPDVDVNQQDKDGFTPLHNAVANNNNLTGTFHVLVSDPRVNLNAVDNNQRTPVHHAASKGRVGLLRRMYATQDIDPSRKFDMDKPGPNGETPFMYAVIEGRRDAVRVFLNEGGINFNAQQTQQRLTPLALAGLGGFAKKDGEISEFSEVDKKLKIFDLLMAHPNIDPNFHDRGVDLLNLMMSIAQSPDVDRHFEDLSPLVQRLVDSARIPGDRKAAAKEWLANHSVQA